MKRIERTAALLTAALLASCHIESADVLDGLVQLVNKSLVLVEREQREETRYRLLEIIRQYALTKLAARGETDSVRKRHTEYYLGIGGRANSQCSGMARMA